MNSFFLADSKTEEVGSNTAEKMLFDVFLCCLMIKVEDDTFMRPLSYVDPFLVGVTLVAWMLALEDPRNCIDIPDILLVLGVVGGDIKKGLVRGRSMKPSIVTIAPQRVSESALSGRI